MKKYSIYSAKVWGTTGTNSNDNSEFSTIAMARKWAKKRAKETCSTVNIFGWDEGDELVEKVLP
jgi:hypothetical protein